MKKTVLTVLMLVLGFGTLFGFAFLVAWRERQPIAVGGDPGAAAAPLESGRDGLYAVVGYVTAALRQGDQTAAVHALDAATRAARTLERATPEEHDAAFAEAYARLQEARRAVQNGMNRAALDKLGEVLVTLDREAEIAGVRPLTPHGRALHEYDGATVIDPHGRRVGELVAVDESGRGDEVTLHVGGTSDLFGCWDFGGREVRVPTAALLFGGARELGSSLVMLAGGTERVASMAERGRQ